MAVWVEILEALRPWLETIGMVGLTGAIAYATYDSHRRSLVKDRINVLEQNYDVLQRLNEAALLNDENLRAAVLSVRPDDRINLDDARIIFFQYLRINRLYRAYEFFRLKVIDDDELDRIWDSYVSTLVNSEAVIQGLSARGYPKDFVAELLKRVRAAQAPPKFEDLVADLRLTGGQLTESDARLSARLSDLDQQLTTVTARNTRR